jgi:hypothetical protein
LVAGYENAYFLVGESVLINLNIVQEILAIENITAVRDAAKGIPRKPATRVACDIREAEVIVGGGPLGDGEDSDLARD